MSTVLVVDDDAAVREVFRRLLERAGYTVRVAEDGAEAIRVASEHHPDLILMDIAMPQMTGTTAAVHLRSAGFSAPIIAISAHVQDSADLAGFASAFDGFAPKPLEARELIAIAHKWTGGPHGSRQSPP